MFGKAKSEGDCVYTAAEAFTPKANTDSAKMDFRLGFLLGTTDSSCSAWLCVSDVLVTASTPNM